MTIEITKKNKEKIVIHKTKRELRFYILVGVRYASITLTGKAKQIVLKNLGE